MIYLEGMILLGATLTRPVFKNYLVEVFATKDAAPGPVWFMIRVNPFAIHRSAAAQADHGDLRSNEWGDFNRFRYGVNSQEGITGGH